MSSSRRRATDAVTAAVNQAVEVVKDQIDTVTGRNRRSILRRRGVVLLLAVGIGIAVWRAWSARMAESTEKVVREAATGSDDRPAGATSSQHENNGAGSPGRTNGAETVRPKKAVQKAG